MKERLADDMARLFASSADLARTVRDEMESVFRTRLEVMLADMGVARKESLETQAILLRQVSGELGRLGERVSALERHLGVSPPAGGDSTAAGPAGDDSAAASPAGGDSAAASPAGGDSAAAGPAGDDSAAASPAGGDSATAGPADRPASPSRS